MPSPTTAASRDPHHGNTVRCKAQSGVAGPYSRVTGATPFAAPHTSPELDPRRESVTCGLRPVVNRDGNSDIGALVAAVEDKFGRP